MSNQETINPSAGTATATGKPIRKPVFTVAENEDGTRIQIALPGVRKEDLKITFNQPVLKIEAVRKNSSAPEWKTHSGTAEDFIYHLALRLSSRLEGNQSKAELENGILSLEVPIREEAKPREISIN